MPWEKLMPIPPGTKLAAVPGMLAAKIAGYNATIGAAYNPPYAGYIAARNSGIAAAGSPSAWLAQNGAGAVQTLLVAFRMNSQNSKLVHHAAFQGVLSSVTPAVLNWVDGLALPLQVAPSNLLNAATGETLSDALRRLYDIFATPGSVTESGGHVAASKTMHCLFPELAPMIDGKHAGISYFNIDRQTYAPPLAIPTWEGWVGAPINGVPNPSPRGAGRTGWKWQQFVAAVGVNQRIYEMWQSANGNPGIQAFLALDPTPGTTGIPRIIDKGLW